MTHIEYNKKIISRKVPERKTKMYLIFNKTILVPIFNEKIDVQFYFNLILKLHLIKSMNLSAPHKSVSFYGSYDV